MLYIPMGFMFLATITTLVQRISVIVKLILAGSGFSLAVEGLQLVVAVLLVALAVMVAFNGVNKLARVKAEDHTGKTANS